MINLKKLNSKQLFGLSALHGILYSLFILVIPCIIVTIKYDVFVTANAGLRITGLGIVVLLAILFFGLGKLKQLIDKIPMDAQDWKAKAKVSLSFVYNVLLPIIILCIAFFIEEDVHIALSVIRSSIISILIGAVEELILGSSVKRENACRENASRMKEAKAREDKV